MQPYPAPSCALCCCVPPRHHHPLHAATTLYTPPPPSTCRHRRRLRATPAAPMCHRQSHHWPLPLRAAPPLSVAFVHAPHAARAPRGAHCRRMCLACVHTSHTGPCATPLHPPCLGPIPGPIRGHAHVSAPIACALTSQAPSTAVPHVSAPIVCTLASRAPSAAVPHVSAPVTCTLTSWAPSAAMRCDHVTMFASRSCATGRHTHIGRAWETVHTL